MKKTFTIIIILLGATLSAKAQSENFHAFKFDFGVGGFPGTNTLSAFNYTLEPHYRIKDNLAFGLRYQYADAGDGGGIGLKQQSGITTGIPVISTDISDVNYKSICLTGDYYLSKDAVQTFVGGGVGVFDQAENGNQTTYSAKPYYYNYQGINNLLPKIGLFARVGLDTWHLRTSIEFDLTNGLYNYLSLNVGYYWGELRK